LRTSQRNETKGRKTVPGATSRKKKKYQAKEKAVQMRAKGSMTSV